MLHPEMKRHRAWWREILTTGVPEKLAELVSSASAMKVCGDSAIVACLSMRHLYNNGVCLAISAAAGKVWRLSDLLLLFEQQQQQ